MTTKKKTVEEPVPVSAEPVQAMEPTAGSACLSVVIPYCKEYAQGNELLFAIRSWYKYTSMPNFRSASSSSATPRTGWTART